MSELSIQVRDVAKRYVLDHKRPGGEGLRHVLQDAVSTAFNWIGRSIGSKNSKETSSDGAFQSTEAFWALDGVSFDVKQGEVVGIIGRNGAGKSTLLKILSRITEPTRGALTLNGRVASLLEVGTGFHPELTGRENIYLNGAILGMSRREIRRRFDEIVEFSEVEKFLDTPVKRYSSGMYVRLAFGVAAHLDPEILIVDEVLAVGDAQFQRKCLGKMGEISRSGGRTVLFVSHNMAAVRKLCSRAVCLQKGRVVMDGDVESVISKYIGFGADHSDAKIELPTPPPESPLDGVILQILSESGNETVSFKLAQPWKARITFKLKRGLSHVIAAIGVRSQEGVPIATWWSAPKDLQEGEYSVEFACNFPLSSGGYQFAVGISVDDTTIYYAEDIGQLWIGESNDGVQPYRSSGCGALITTDRPEIQSARDCAVSVA